MSDESGGDFGGGSVKWEIRYKENSAPRHNENVFHGGGSTPVAGKKRSHGSEDTTETNFYLVLKNTVDETLRDRLNDAVTALNRSPRPNEVVINLPIRNDIPKQIRVLWEDPRGHGPTVSRSEQNTPVQSE